MAEIPLTEDKFAAALENMGAAIAKGIEDARPQKVTIGQYEASPGRNPFHPNKSKSKQLKHEWFQNGQYMFWETLLDREVELLNQIHRSGRYINRLIEVIVTTEGSQTRGDLRYRNRSIDDRLEHKSRRGRRVGQRTTQGI
jgi:hypothetical protein